MLLTLPDDETLYAALLARDPAWEGFAYVGVTSTGVFCRLTCTARKPKRENCQFFPLLSACLEAGFRPCKRCRPLAGSGNRDPQVAMLLDALEQAPERRWSEQDLVEGGHDPSTVRRAFKRQFGITFLEMARLRRLAKGVNALSDGVKIIDAQQETHYESSSGFRAAIARHFGSRPGDITHRAWLYADWIDTPIGAMLAVADEKRLHLLEFFDRQALPAELTRLKAITGSGIISSSNAIIEQTARQLEAWFAGDLTALRVPLMLHGSPFTQRVWQALQAIPAGQVCSYSALANSIDQPGASRAVARANGANQIAIIIPCHRVIGADGSLTGYAGGLWRKRWLIGHERRFATA